MLPATGFWMALFWAVAVLLVVAGFLRVRSRLPGRREPDALTDADVRAIEERGVIERDGDEPLDLDRIEEEERRFWESESWDEAEEW